MAKISIIAEVDIVNHSYTNIQNYFVLKCNINKESI